MASIESHCVIFQLHLLESCISFNNIIALRVEITNSLNKMNVTPKLYKVLFSECYTFQSIFRNMLPFHTSDKYHFGVLS